MKKWKNAVHVEGYIFKHSLKTYTSKKTGVPFVMGDIEICVDDRGLMTVPVHFGYTAEKTSTGKVNSNYPLLMQILQENKTYETAGTQAPRVRVDGYVATNDFYTRDGQLASPKRIEASFIHPLTNKQIAAPTFSGDMIIKNTVLHDNEDDTYLDINGYMFDFFNNIYPVTFSVNIPAAIEFFQSQDYPFVTVISGEIENLIVERKRTLECAWGEPVVETTSQSIRSWNIKRMTSPISIPDDDIISKEELQAALANREQKLAAEKQRRDDYLAQRDALPFDKATTAAPSPAAPTNVWSPTSFANYNF